jgi:hypothetical protein
MRVANPFLSLRSRIDHESLRSLGILQEMLLFVVTDNYNGKHSVHGTGDNPCS